MTRHDPTLHQKSTNVRISAFRHSAALLSRLAPRPTARLAERLFVTPFRSARPTREECWAADAHRLRLEHDGAELAVWTWGTGERTVLLVHGWAGRGLQLGGFVAPLLAAGLRVVAFDGPGHGASNGSTSSLPELASAAAAVGRAFAPVEAVIAHSLGAAAALLAVTRGGLECDRLSLISPVASLEAIGHTFADLTGFSPEVVARMRHRLERRLSFSWPDIEPAVLARAVHRPVLVVHDRDDRETPWQGGRALADALPDGRFHPSTGLGHHRILRDPQIIDHVTRFTADLADEAVA